MRETLGSADDGVVVEHQLDGFVRQAIDRTIPALAPRMRAERDRIFQAAFDRWPVRSGYSRRSLVRTEGLFSDVDGEAYDVGIGNDADYWKYVFTKREVFAGESKHAWTWLARRPMQEAGDVLAEELGADLLRMLGEA